jgi:hypothetical protein
LIKALCRVPTLIMELKITPQSDVDGLVNYWAGCIKADTLRPLLESMSRVPGGATLNISYFMPGVPRGHLYTYPNPASPAREDCFFSSFNFFNEQPDPRFIDPAYADRVLQSDFEEIRGAKRFGDLMLLMEGGERAVHMCVYVAADIIYTKNGGHPFQPWVLMKMNDLMVQYPSEKALRWRVFRKRHS